ncbi:MAG TPA: hypothetical protein V6C57_21235 [Coleofasciculaceae cyanobacterium]
MDVPSLDSDGLDAQQGLCILDRGWTAILRTSCVAMCVAIATLPLLQIVAEIARTYLHPLSSNLPGFITYVVF